MAANDELINAVGPGLAEEQQPTGHSQIEGFDDYRWVEVFNPMSVDFVGQVGLTKPIAAPIHIGGADDPQSPQVTKSEAEIRQTYGFDMRANAQASGKTHIRTKVPIKAGQSIRLLGSEAQVLVMQLATALIQQEGHSNIGDPTLRAEAESRIIRSTGDVRANMNTAPQSERAQLEQALASMNDAPATNVVNEGIHEVEFPDATQRSAGTSAEDGGQIEPQISEPAKRLGRPPKTA